MTKNELADALVGKTGLSKSDAITAIDGLIEAAKDAFVRGSNIYLRGFGTFRLEQRAAKKARNIKKGTIVNVPAHCVVKFKPCNELKELVEYLPPKVNNHK